MAVRKHASPAWVRQVVTRAIWGSVTNARAKNDWSKIEHAVQQYEFVRIITPTTQKQTISAAGSGRDATHSFASNVKPDDGLNTNVFACHPRAPGSEPGA
jgi:hypothetical protein